MDSSLPFQTVIQAMLFRLKLFFCYHSGLSVANNVVTVRLEK